MKQTFYILKNFSKSEGTYFVDNEYKSIYPGEEITLNKYPTNCTANVSITLYRKDVGKPEFQYKKKRS